MLNISHSITEQQGSRKIILLNGKKYEQLCIEIDNLVKTSTTNFTIENIIYCDIVSILPTKQPQRLQIWIYNIIKDNEIITDLIKSDNIAKQTGVVLFTPIIIDNKPKLSRKCIDDMLIQYPYLLGQKQNISQ